jgi:hypothetical protein
MTSYPIPDIPVIIILTDPTASNALSLLNQSLRPRPNPQPPMLLPNLELVNLGILI